jgi:hypothetical protein
MGEIYANLIGRIEYLIESKGLHGNETRAAKELNVPLGTYRSWIKSRGKGFGPNFETFMRLSANLHENEFLWLITGEPKFLGEEIRGAPTEKPLGEGDTGGETVDLLKKMKPEEVRDIFHSAADRIFLNHDKEIIDFFIDHAMSNQIFHRFVKVELKKRKDNPSSKKADIVKEGSG